MWGTICLISYSILYADGWQRNIARIPPTEFNHVLLNIGDNKSPQKQVKMDKNQYLNFVFNWQYLILSYVFAGIMISKMYTIQPNSSFIITIDNTY